MASSLHFDIDTDQLRGLALDLQATDKQVRFALGRALQRTAATLRRDGVRGLRSELDIKKIDFLRRRLKSVRFRGAGPDGAKLWYGLNDAPVSALRGRMTRTAKGAQFAGKAGSAEFAGGFLGKSARGYGRTIFTRRSGARLPLDEAALPIYDKMVTHIEDNIFDKMDEIFWRHFERDLAARVRLGVGATEYRRGRSR